MKNVGLYGVRICFGFGETVNGLVDEVADGALPLPRFFCARTTLHITVVFLLFLLFI